MSTVNISTARDNLPEVIETARTEAVILERYGRPAAVVVSPERYEQLMNALDEVDDVAAFDEAMAEEGPNIPWSDGKGRSGLGVSGLPHRAAPGGRPSTAQARPADAATHSGCDSPPRPRIPDRPGPAPFRGRPGLRIRVGDYRIIYTVQDDVLLIVVVTLGHRREVYER